MNGFLAFWRSSIAAQLVMAVSGAGLLLFAIAHLLGNLQAFLGPEALNHYAKTLRAIPPLPCVFPFGLFVLRWLQAERTPQLPELRVARFDEIARTP